MNILEVKNLNLGFETEAGFKQALFDVSFSLEKGKTHAIVGESGCGKTISAMSIINLLPKTAKITGGEIILKGKGKVEKGKDSSRSGIIYPLARQHEIEINLLKLNNSELEQVRGAKIALIPQDPMTSLNPLYTIGDQLIEVIKKHQGVSGKKAKEIAIKSLELVQIPSARERLNIYPHEFSGGMKQRAIIAMALACNAQIIIADEPTTALDVTIQAQIMDILDNIKKETGTSILLITHDLELVKDYADKISVMYAGRIVETADAKEFFANPNHPYSKALLKSRPSDKGEKLVIIKGQPPSIQQEICGCRFHPRCGFAMPVCSIEVPEFKEIKPSHFSACHLN